MNSLLLSGPEVQLNGSELSPRHKYYCCTQSQLTILVIVVVCNLYSWVVSVDYFFLMAAFITLLDTKRATCQGEGFQVSSTGILPSPVFKICSALSMWVLSSGSGRKPRTAAMKYTIWSIFNSSDQELEGMILMPDIDSGVWNVIP